MDDRQLDKIEIGDIVWARHNHSYLGHVGKVTRLNGSTITMFIKGEGYNDFLFYKVKPLKHMSVITSPEKLERGNIVIVEDTTKEGLARYSLGFFTEFKDGTIYCQHDISFGYNPSKKILYRAPFYS